MTGITASNKQYNATTVATLVGTGTLVGVINPDVVTLNTTNEAGAFLTKTVGIGKTVQVAGLALVHDEEGAYLNYSLTQPTTTADITPATLTVTGVTASNKVYDGTTTASLNTSSASLTGVIQGDAVSLITSGATGSFADKIVANNKPVTVSGSILSGADAGNYALSPPSGITANITARPLAIVATGVNKPYDGTTTATVTTTDNRVAGDVFTVTDTAAFGDANVGTNKTVNVISISLSGTDAANYSTPSTETTTANITPLALTATGITAANKAYDGTTTATIDTSACICVVY